MNTPAYPYQPAASSGVSVTGVLMQARDWLDQRGKPAWIVAMILGFVFVWPLGLAILGYMIWSKRMFGSCHHRTHRTNGRSHRFHRAESTGNAAFDAYRDETLKRLEDENRAFVDFLQKLRDARDKAEFDQFMDERKQPDAA